MVNRFGFRTDKDGEAEGVDAVTGGVYDGPSGEISERVPPIPVHQPKYVKHTHTPTGTSSAVDLSDTRHGVEGLGWTVPKQVKPLNCEATTMPSGHSGKSTHFIVEPGGTLEGAYPVCSNHHAEIMSSHSNQISTPGGDVMRIKKDDEDVDPAYSFPLEEKHIEHYRALRKQKNRQVRTQAEGFLHSKGLEGDDLLIARKKRAIGPGRGREKPHDDPSSGASSVTPILERLGDYPSDVDSNITPARQLSAGGKEPTPAAKMKANPERYLSEGNPNYTHIQPDTGIGMPRSAADRRASEAMASKGKISRLLEFHTAGHPDIYGKAQELGLSDSELEDAHEQISQRERFAADPKSRPTTRRSRGTIALTGIPPRTGTHTERMEKAFDSLVEKGDAKEAIEAADTQEATAIRDVRDFKEISIKQGPKRAKEFKDGIIQVRALPNPEDKD